MATNALSLDELEFRQRPGEVHDPADYGLLIMRRLRWGDPAEEADDLIKSFTEDDSTTAQAVNA